MGFVIVWIILVVMGAELPQHIVSIAYTHLTVIFLMSAFEMRVVVVA